MAREVVMAALGGPKVLSLRENSLPLLGPDEVRIRQSVIGVNFIDIYFRRGIHPLPGYPAVLGVEGAGIVTEIGQAVASFVPGDRVAYAGAPVGAYADERNLPAARLVKLPDDLPERVAGSAMLRGLTAHMVLTKVTSIGPGDFVLVHAAAGGLGQMLSSWTKRLGATVIGTVGSESKADVARKAGADYILLRSGSDWVAQVRELTSGRGVHLAYDGIGGALLAQTMACIRPFGMIASLGQAGGAIPDMPVNDLGPIRSIALSRPSVMAYSADPSLYRPAAAAVLDVLRAGLAPPIDAEFGLADAAEAHAALEAGRTTGSVILTP